MSKFSFPILLLLLVLANVSCNSSKTDAQSIDDDNVNNTEFDSKLIWHDEESGLSWQRIKSETNLTWWQARNYCESYVTDTSQWRLPTISELRSIVKNCKNLELDGDCGFFDQCSSSICDYAGGEPTFSCNRCEYSEPYGDPDKTYWPEEMQDVFYDTEIWSSIKTDRAALTINFGVKYSPGILYRYLEETHDKIWAVCVKGDFKDPIAEKLEVCSIADPPENGEVWFDSNTNLMWQKSPSENRTEWKNAAEYCESMMLGDYADWRLPSIDELRTLVRGCPNVETTGLCCISENACTWYGGCNDEGFCPHNPKYCDCDVPCSCCANKGPNNGCYGPSELDGPCKDFWSRTASSGDFGWGLDFSASRTFASPWPICSHIRCVRGEQIFPDGDMDEEIYF